VRRNGASRPRDRFAVVEPRPTVVERVEFVAVSPLEQRAVADRADPLDVPLRIDRGDRHGNVGGRRADALDPQTESRAGREDADRAGDV
jgi:hypothetical protein